VVAADDDEAVRAIEVDGRILGVHERTRVAAEREVEVDMTGREISVVVDGKKTGRKRQGQNEERAWSEPSLPPFRPFAQHGRT
jgi:hypothetical protein